MWLPSIEHKMWYFIRMPSFLLSIKWKHIVNRDYQTHTVSLYNLCTMFHIFWSNKINNSLNYKPLYDDSLSLSHSSQIFLHLHIFKSGIWRCVISGLWLVITNVISSHVLVTNWNAPGLWIPKALFCQDHYHLEWIRAGREVITPYMQNRTEPNIANIINALNVTTLFKIKESEEFQKAKSRLCTKGEAGDGGV